VVQTILLVPLMVAAGDAAINYPLDFNDHFGIVNVVLERRPRWQPWLVQRWRAFASFC